jgi:Bacterial mobilisation protein (MobC)
MMEFGNRSSKLTIRLSETERATLRNTAEKLRLTESEHVRKILLDRGELKQIVIPQINQEACQELGRLRIELTRQGVNLNQLVKLAHYQTPSDTAARLEALTNIQKQLQAAINNYQSQLMSGYDRQN